jgi:hypothetical protein
MKNILLPLLVALALTACQQSPQQIGLREALTEKLKQDSDLKDYKIDPAQLAECVYKEIEDTAPGIPGDPKRDRYFEAFTKFVAVGAPGEAEKAITDYKDLFGGVQEARQAALSVTDMIMGCMGGAVDAQAPN